MITEEEIILEFPEDELAMDPSLAEPELELDEEEDDEFDYDENASNLVDEFMEHEDGKAALREIAADVFGRFEAEWDAQSPYMEECAKVWKLFSCDVPPRSPPFENSANLNVPIVLENISRLALRTFGEIFSDWSTVFTVRALGPQDDAQAEVLTLHGNWQFREQLDDFPTQMFRAVLSFWLWEFTVHSYYDERLQKNRHVTLAPDEFIYPHRSRTSYPNYADSPWVARIIYKHKHELEALKDVWYDVEKVLDDDPPSWDEDPLQPVAEANEEISSLDKNDEEPAARRIIMWEGWLDLPLQENQRYVQVIMDYHTKAIFRMAIHEEADWQDKARYDLQSGELAQYRAAMDSYNMAVGEMQAAMQAQESMLMGHEEGLADATEQALGDVAMGANPDAAAVALDEMEMAPPPQIPIPPEPERPPSPSWLTDPENPDALPPPVRQVPILNFVRFCCIEPLQAGPGLSFGKIQATFNIAANVALSQFIDQGSLANAPPVIANADAQLPDTISMVPGKIVKVSGLVGGKLQDAFMPMPVSPANQQLREIVGLAQQWAQQSIQSTNVLSGEPGKSGETYRGISARIEQANKQISVAAQRFLDSFIYIVRNNAKLNSKFLPEEELVLVTDNVQNLSKEVRVTRAMYERDYRVQMRADLRFTTQSQKVQEADEIAGLMMQHPAVFNPQMGLTNWRMVYECLKAQLIARRRHDLVGLLGMPPEPTQMFGPPPPPPPPPPGMGPPQDPNAPPQDPNAPPQGPPQGPPPQG